MTKFCLAVRRHVGQDVAIQCSCVSQELAEETSQEQCMIVVKLVVDQAGQIMVNLLRVGAFTKFWLELQAVCFMTAAFSAQIGLRKRCSSLSSVLSLL